MRVHAELEHRTADAPLRWQGPEVDRWVSSNVLETGALREMISDVAWGELDVLLLKGETIQFDAARLFREIEDLVHSMLPQLERFEGRPRVGVTAGASAPGTRQGSGAAATADKSSAQRKISWVLPSSMNRWVVVPWVAASRAPWRNTSSRLLIAPAFSSSVSSTRSVNSWLPASSTMRMLPVATMDPVLRSLNLVHVAPCRDENTLAPNPWRVR